jgi:hypothetical protein
MRIFFALDPAGSRNSFTAACVGNEAGNPLWYILGLWAERPTDEEPLDVAGVVVPKMANICLAMGCTEWMSDAHESNSVKTIGAKYGIATRFQGGTLLDIWDPLRKVVHTGNLRAAGPKAAEALRQSSLITEVVNDRGVKTLYIPHEGTEHCDDATALARALYHAGAGKDARPFDAREWEEANRQFLSSRATTSPRNNATSAELFRHPRSR